MTSETTQWPTDEQVPDEQISNEHIPDEPMPDEYIPHEHVSDEWQTVDSIVTASPQLVSTNQEGDDVRVLPPVPDDNTFNAQTYVDEESAADTEQNIQDAMSVYSPDVDSLTCSVCLEFYYQPHKCEPCKHVYCGPCLQRLRASSSLRTKCPLCRQIIRKCRPENRLSKKIQRSFPGEYKRRRLVEKPQSGSLPPLPGLSALSLLHSRPVNALTILSATCFVVLLMIAAFTVFTLTIGVFFTYLTQYGMDVFVDVFLELSNLLDGLYQAGVIWWLGGGGVGDAVRMLSQSLQRISARFVNHSEDVHVDLKPKTEAAAKTSPRQVDFSQVANYLVVGLFGTYVLYRLAKYRQNQLNAAEAEQ